MLTGLLRSARNDTGTPTSTNGMLDAACELGDHRERGGGRRACMGCWTQPLSHIPSSPQVDWAGRWEGQGAAPARVGGRGGHGREGWMIMLESAGCQIWHMTPPLQQMGCRMQPLKHCLIFSGSKRALGGGRGPRQPLWGRAVAGGPAWGPGWIGVWVCGCMDEWTQDIPALGAPDLSWHMITPL